MTNGIYSANLNRLILVKITINEFAYVKALLLLEEDFDNLKKNQNMIIQFKQGWATSPSSQSIKFLIQKLFEENFIQNHPNSPGFAYPIENIWDF